MEGAGWDLSQFLQSYVIFKPLFTSHRFFEDSPTHPGTLLYPLPQNGLYLETLQLVSTLSIAAESSMEILSLETSSSSRLMATLEPNSQTSVIPFSILETFAASQAALKPSRRPNTKTGN